MQTAPYQILSSQALTQNLCLFWVKPLNRALRITPGQYVEIEIDGQWAPFSVAGFDGDTLEFHLKHLPDNPLATRFYQKLQSQACLQLRGGLGHCTQQALDAPYVFIAGGTGISAHKSLIEHLLEIPTEHRPPIQLYWGVRTLDDYYLPSWFEGLKRSVQTHLVVSEPEPNWHGPSGLIHRYWLAQKTHPENGLTFASGPYPMVKAVEQAFVELGRDRRLLYSDMLNATCEDA